MSAGRLLFCSRGDQGIKRFWHRDFDGNVLNFNKDFKKIFKGKAIGNIEKWGQSRKL